MGALLPPPSRPSQAQYLAWVSWAEYPGGMLKQTLLVATLVLLSTPARADIPPDIEPGNEFVNHHLRIENMGDHPDFALLVYDAPDDGRIRASAVFSSAADAQQFLTNGGNWQSRSEYRRPRLWLLPLDSQEAWSASASAEVAAQRTACMERGEGCMHISRFTPNYLAPTDAIDCGAEFQVQTERAVDPDTSRDVVTAFRLVEASAETCVVEPVETATTAAAEDDGPALPWVFIGVGLFTLGGLLVVAWVRRGTPQRAAA